MRKKAACTYFKKWPSFKYGLSYDIPGMYDGNSVFLDLIDRFLDLI